MGSHRLSLEALIGPHSVPLGRHSHDCSYLTRRSATEEAWLVWQISPAAYHELMDRGFRRSGNILYRTVCASCRKCVPIRVPVDAFKPSRSQRRALARNDDVRMIVHEPELNAEKHDVYKRYLRAQHDKSPQGEDMESMRDFLYSSCVATVVLLPRLLDRRLRNHGLQAAIPAQRATDRRRVEGLSHGENGVARSRSLCSPWLPLD